MKHAATFVLLAVFGILPGFAQTPTQTDSQTLQAILTEMRALQNDVRLGATTQILLTEMELQRGVVDKAQEKRDSARSRVSQLQMNEKNFAAQLSQFEDAAKTTMDPVRQKQLADQQQNLKTTMANFKSQEDDATNASLDADSALRREQDTLSGIQEQLNEVVKKLQPASNP